MADETDEPLVPVVPAGAGRASLRASDADRDLVAEHVRSAAVDGRLDMSELDERLGAVFAAKTYGDLAATVTDLPDSGAQLPVPASGATGSGVARAGDGTVAQPGGARVPRIVDGPENGLSVAVFSESGHRGHWVVPEKYAAIAVMGSVHLDLRDADFAAAEVAINAFALFGSVEIRVPEGVTVRANGIGLFGSFDAAGGFDAGPGAPVLVVRGAGLFGSVEVKRAKPTRGALGGGGDGALGGGGGGALRGGGDGALGQGAGDAHGRGERGALDQAFPEQRRDRELRSTRHSDDDRPGGRRDAS